MGHSHSSSSSSSHKRLRSISSAKNCGEFTEVVDLEFSDVAVNSEPKPLTTIMSDIEATPVNVYPKELLTLEERVQEIKKNMETLSPDEFFVYFPSLKDDLHNCWQKVYGVKETNADTKLKKHEIIDRIRELLRQMNSRLQRREFGF